MPDDIYRGRVAMQRRIDELFPRGLSLEVLDTELVPGVPVQTGIQAPCGRVFCSAMVMPGEPLPTLWLLRFDFTTRIDPDPWVELGRPWEAWMDGVFHDARQQTYRADTYRFKVLSQDGDPVGWTAYVDADPPENGPLQRAVKPRYRRYATDRWEQELFPEGLGDDA